MRRYSTLAAVPVFIAAGSGCSVPSGPAPDARPPDAEPPSAFVSLALIPLDDASTRLLSGLDDRTAASLTDHLRAVRSSLALHDWGSLRAAVASARDAIAFTLAAHDDAAPDLAAIALSLDEAERIGAPSAAKPTTSTPRPRQ